MEMVPVNKSAGSILCHDLTQVVAGEFKGPTLSDCHMADCVFFAMSAGIPTAVLETMLRKRRLQC